MSKRETFQHHQDMTKTNEKKKQITVHMISMHAHREVTMATSCSCVTNYVMN